MTITPIKTCRVESAATSITELIDRYVETVAEKDILVVTSKIVSICEGRVVPRDTISKESLLKQEATYYLPAEASKYGHHFTITHDTLIATAGIDESNSNNGYILWPKDSQETANILRQYLVDRFNLRHVGIIITDSTSTPLRLGVTGIALSHSGFRALNDYVGKPDLFGRPFTVSQSNIAGGLAASAVVAMGEGAEQTPLALISDVPFVSFQDRMPTIDELQQSRVSKEDDLFAPFLEKAEWLKGDKAGSNKPA